jgi:hypothetical protein
MLRSVDWWLATDVSGQPIAPIFKDQTAEEEFLDCLSHEGETDRLPRNVGYYNQRCVTSQKSKYLIYTAAEV